MADNIFEDDAPQKVEDPTQEEQIANYKDLYVGEGKKYANEDEAFKGLHHANATLTQIKSEQAELRKELERRTTLEEFVSRLTDQQKEMFETQTKQTQETPSGVHSNGESINQEQKVPDMEGLSKEEIAQLVADQINQSKEQDTRLRNLRNSQEELRKRWGQNYISHLENKAGSLGVSKEFLNEMAQTHPQAFLELVGANAERHSGNESAPRSIQNSAATSSTNKGRGKSFYRELRKTDPNRYFNPSTQNQMQKDMMAMGDEFYNN